MPRTISARWERQLKRLTKVKRCFTSHAKGSHEQSETLWDQNGLPSRRLGMLERLIFYYGKELGTLPFNSSLEDRECPVPPVQVTTYPFSHQKEATRTLLSITWRHNPCNPIWEIMRWRFSKVRELISFNFRSDSSTVLTKRDSVMYQRTTGLIYALFDDLRDVLVCLLVWLLKLFIFVVLHVLSLVGVKLPGLSILQSMRSLYGKSPYLPLGENGYTKVFQGGDHIDLDELEGELMARNKEPSHDQLDRSTNVNTVTTISISYKHYANSGNVPDDDHRICRTDLEAIAKFIKLCVSCKLRFWIDSKLPPTNDDTFERWLDRGVRPYGRYLTFLCPSAQQYATASFWLANEYHFAADMRGVMYFKGDRLYHEFREGITVGMLRRLLHVVIGAEDHPTQVRQEDSAKVVQWAMCCLQADYHGGDPYPGMDKMAMEGRNEYYLFLMHSIGLVIRRFGEQELPIVPGKSWNGNNPLLLKGLPDQQHDLSIWYGVSQDTNPEIVYFLPPTSFVTFSCYKRVLVLEVMLERSHVSVGKIRVLRKVFREESSTIISRCKFVTVPWLCEWE